MNDHIKDNYEKSIFLTLFKEFKIQFIGLFNI